MFRKNNSNNNSSETIVKKIAPSVISSDINLLGNIISEGLIDFDGSIDGNIQCHTLLVRANARINGEVKADTVQVSGRVYGTIRARVVTLHENAHVEGTIMHEQITVEDGATVDGKLKKINKAESPTSMAPTLMVPNMSTVAADNQDDAEDIRIMEHIRLIAANS